MDIEAFKTSLEDEAPPAGLDGALYALWYDARGDWHAAHRQAQDQGDADGAWVHAYLHRVEGDQSNAGGWYRRAGKPHCETAPADEWAAIAAALLAR